MKKYVKPDGLLFHLYPFNLFDSLALQRQSVVDDLPAILFTGFEASRKPMYRGFRIVVKLDRRTVFAWIDAANGRSVDGGFDAEERDHAVLVQDGSSRLDVIVLVVKIVKSLDLVAHFVVKIEIGFELKFVIHFVGKADRKRLHCMPAKFN